MVCNPEDRFLFKDIKNRIKQFAFSDRIKADRRFIKDILDEPTVGLDAVTERELLDTIFDVFKEKTILWITHHLAGVETADKIVFLENGKAEMEGTHQELVCGCLCSDRNIKTVKLPVPFVFCKQLLMGSFHFCFSIF